MAIGKSGAAFRQEDVAIDIMGLPVCRLGGILRQLGVDCLRLAAGERDSD